MAVSNSFDFTLNRDALIKRALLLLGVISASQTPTTEEIDSGSKALNLMLKAWQADGLNLWQIRNISVTPVSPREGYTMGDATKNINTGVRPLDVIDVYRRETSTKVDVPLKKLTREEYWRLGDKNTTGTPTSFYYDPQLNTGTLYIWPVADSTFAANNTLQISYSKQVDDMDSASDTLSFPQEWELAIVYGLAVILAPEYGYPLSDRRFLRQEAELEKQRVLDWDTEHGSIFIRPEAR